MPTLSIKGPRNRVLSTWKFMRDPFSCYRKWKNEFGDTFLVRAMNGDVVVTCNRENIRRIFALPSESVEQFAVDTIKPLVGDSSIFLLQGTKHRCERAMLSPSFHGERIEGKAQLIQETTNRATRHWKQGDRIRLMDVTLDISLEVIIRVVFGVQSIEKVAILEDAIKRFVNSFHPLLAFTRLLHRPLLGLGPWNNFVGARNELHQLLDQEIKLRQDNPGEGDDLLSRMVFFGYKDGSKVGDAQMREHLIAMLLAGHETTQIAMAWAMSWLHRDPQRLERLRSELEQCHCLGEQIGNEYLQGVCNEALRLNSVLPDTARRLKLPLSLVDCELPAGTNVVVAFSLVHEDQDLYPEPFCFRPERWETFSPRGNEFMPFGGGIRRCIGATLALLEMKIVVATLVSNYRFLLPDDAPESEQVVRRNVTMAPKSGIPLIIESEIT